MKFMMNIELDEMVVQDVTDEVLEMTAGITQIGTIATGTCCFTGKFEPCC